MRKLYAVLLNVGSRGAARRFALYQPDAQGDLEVLWGERETERGDIEFRADARAKLPHMLYSQAPNLPAFHFKLTPGGRFRIDRTEDALEELAESLANHWGETVSIQLLHGWHAYEAARRPDYSSPDDADLDPETAALYRQHRREDDQP